MPHLTLTETSKATANPSFSHLLWHQARAALIASQRFTVLLRTYLMVCNEAAMQQSTKQT